jgi:hypothetical protein
MSVQAKPTGRQPWRAYAFIEEYPGAYRWPLTEVLCPECGQWAKQYGDVSVLSDDGHEHYLCVPCGQKVGEERE